MSQPRRRPLHRVGDLLAGLATELGLQDELQAARAISSWRRVVEERVPAAAGATRLIELRPPVCIVSADDPATAQELRLHTTELLDAFANMPGGRRLLELKIVIQRPS